MPVQTRSVLYASHMTSSWLNAVLAMRDRLLSSARFRHWAIAFPVTRPIARRRARALFDLCAGFVYSQTLLACVELRLFDKLSEGPQSVPLLAGFLAMPEDAALRLLAAATSLRLVARRGTRFGLGPLGAALVDNPGLLAMIQHHRMLYADLDDPVALLRGQKGERHLARYWSYAEADQPRGLGRETIISYTNLMSASQPLVAAEVIAAYRFIRHRCLLDVGGGDGTFLSAVAKAAPHLKLMLFDLPAVAEQAQERLVRNGVSGRAAVVGGDFLHDELPKGADVISLVRVIHDHDDDRALSVLQATRRALPIGGTLLVAEPMSGLQGIEPVGDAYFGFYLLAMGRGKARTQAELSLLLGRAGFSDVRRIATRAPLLTSLLMAHAS
jgi:demethylspheroidene O-methyltransferase